MYFLPINQINIFNITSWADIRGIIIIMRSPPLPRLSIVFQ